MTTGVLTVCVAKSQVGFWFDFSKNQKSVIFSLLQLEDFHIKLTGTLNHSRYTLDPFILLFKP